MAKILFDNNEYEVPEGTNLLKAAREAGFAIPSLCYNDKLPHYTSCMVCIVKDKRTNNFIPSCSSQVNDGMDIDLSSEEVSTLRRKSIELLLSEHRAECEAPCRIVCPSGYNIPLFNRYLSAGNTDDAISLTMREAGRQELACITCQGYCENACRRKKIDAPVSIRNMKLFMYRKTGPVTVHEDAVIKTGKRTASVQIRKRFNSLIGRLELSEQEEWLKESNPDAARFREIMTIESATSESAACMHCDCRASENCRLRDLADELMIRDPRGKLVSSPVVKKINRKTGLIFENAKCIKCGLCVRLCSEMKEEPALCFINRGFASIISEPLTWEFDNILESGSRELTEICPTGALSLIR